MTKTDIKHIDELGKASRIIRELGYELDESMCDDRPDIVWPSKTDRQIGIEVVTYSSHRYEESENVLYKMFNEYIEVRLDKRSDTRLEIGVMSEYYLVVFFPINEHAELRGYTLSETFKIAYDRIYLVDPFYMNRIK